MEGERRAGPGKYVEANFKARTRCLGLSRTRVKGRLHGRESPGRAAITTVSLRISSWTYGSSAQQGTVTRQIKARHVGKNPD
jgi:hypothetical protein